MVPVTSTGAAAAAAASLPSPPSPTLTNPDMILPDSPNRAPSPPLQLQLLSERPSSPATFLRHHGSNLSLQQQQRINAAVQDRSNVASPPLSTVTTARPSFVSQTSTEYHRRKLQQTGELIASSPTLMDSRSGSVLDSWQAFDDRTDAASVRSVEMEGAKWHGFDGPLEEETPVHAMEEDGEDEEDAYLEEQEEEIGPLPKAAGFDDEFEHDGWLDGQDGEDDSFSHAILSRRAEIILANAKKRLNVMEGNLRGARHSLLSTPATASSLRMASELSSHLAASRERERRLYNGIGAFGMRQRPYQSSPLSPGSPGHSRVLSETSLPFTATQPYGYAREQRSTSALGSVSRPWSSADRMAVRESKSHEMMRNVRDPGTGLQDERENGVRKVSPSLRASPTPLGPVPEDDSPTLHRPPSATSNLRVQMDQLKGRISSLKLRAQEDGMRRRSLQSLRTPSPFTSAEIWYSGVEGYKANPTANGDGLGQAQGAPQNEQKQPSTGSSEGTPNANPSPAQYTESNYEDAEEANEAYGATKANEASGEPDNSEDQHQEQPAEAVEHALEHVHEHDQKLEQNEGPYEHDTEIETDAESIYEDAEYYPVATERHEDRADAFDYENFFLHSAMGSYSANSRRSSVSSDDSVATTRPAPAMNGELETTPTSKRLSENGLHHRNISVDSVSTVATFATAAERPGSDYGSDEDEANDGLDMISNQILDRQQATSRAAESDIEPAAVVSKNATDVSVKPVTAAAAAHGQVNGNVASQQVADGTAGMPVAHNHPASKITSILVNAAAVSTGRLSLEKADEELIYTLAVSLQQVCMNLQDSAGDQYERRVWRRRLDAARRVLNGENDGEVF